MIEISLGLIAELTGKKQPEIEDLQKSESFDLEKLIKDSFSAKVEKARKEGWDSSAAKAKAELYTEVEKKISEKLEVKKAGIEEMLDEFKEKKFSEVQISPEQIRNSDIFKTAVDKLQKENLKIKTETESEIKTLKSKEIDRELRGKVTELAKVNKWDVQKEGMIDLLVSGLKSSYAFDLDNGLKIKTIDGKDIVDDLQNVLDFDTVVTQKGNSAFNIIEADGRQSPGNTGTTTKSIKIDPFKDVNDYFNRVQSETDPEKLAVMKAQYEAQAKAGEF